MSKLLIVMRHAKSSWDSPGSDRERPLSKRGRNGATALGAWLRAQGLTPDEALVSSAVRTEETASRLKLNTAPILNKELYLAPSDVLLKHVRRATGDTVLLVAHNPGIGEFAERLAQSAPNHPRFFDYPSGATCVFQCDIESWADLNFGTANVIQFITPRDLT